MWERLRSIFGSGAQPKEESATELAAGYYAEAQQEAAQGNADIAIRQLAFAAELDDSYRVRATSDPAFDALREDSRYKLVVNRSPRTT